MGNRAGGALFAVVPDVIQNGEDGKTVPWDEVGAIFIGGDDSYKEGSDARWITLCAKERGLHVHMGRVNSLRRMRIADGWGCDTVDGTYLAFGPDVNTPRLSRMLDVIGAGKQLQLGTW